MPEANQNALKNHCTLIAKHLSVLVPMFGREQQTYGMWKEMYPIAQELDQVFQAVTGFASMGRDSQVGYFPNDTLVFKSPASVDWIQVATQLAAVIKEHSEVLKKLSEEQGASKNQFFPTVGSVNMAAETFCNRYQLITQELASCSLEGTF